MLPPVIKQYVLPSQRGRQSTAMHVSHWWSAEARPLVPSFLRLEASLQSTVYTLQQGGPLAPLCLWQLFHCSGGKCWCVALSFRGLTTLPSDRVVWAERGPKTSERKYSIVYASTNIIRKFCGLFIYVAAFSLNFRV